MDANLYDIAKGHGRCGFHLWDNKVQLVVYVSEDELPIGSVAEKHDEEVMPLCGFVISSAEQIREIGKYFVRAAEEMEKKGWFESAAN